MSTSTKRLPRNLTSLRRDHSWYGWRPDLPDARDYNWSPKLFTGPRGDVQALPDAIDLRQTMPQKIYDQGSLGSCGANALASIIQHLHLTLKQRDFMPSRLQMYYDTRVIEGTPREDSGIEIRDIIKAVAKNGAAPESSWPYRVGKFAVQPSAKVYANASKHLISQYARITPNTVDDLRRALATGLPIIFGFTVYDYFEGQQIEKDGILYLPESGEKNVGGHAVVLVGYFRSTLANELGRWRFIVRNSWGKAWGQGGYFTMPMEYVLNRNLSDDFWTVALIA